ncbi:hypothetical protein [Micromonospora aurantiaca (nom. illeg.)]|uniref:hypothetical protein n=1 Tax=Micromonospora aurantiaca (nom. illeg.) TaxID=47850 RepID=UPI0037905F6F
MSSDFDNDGLPLPSRRTRRADALWDGFTTRMLADDLEHLVPFNRDAGWRVDLTLDGVEVAGPLAEDLRRRLALALPSHDYYGDDTLEDALAGFLRLTASHMVIHGRARFEAYHQPIELPEAYDGEPSETDPSQPERLNLGLALLDDGRVRHLPGLYWQAVTTSEGRVTGWVKVPRRSVVTFQLPSGRRRQIRRILRTVLTADRAAPTAHAVDFLRLGLPYSVAEHSRRHRTVLARVMAPLGYAARGLLTEETTTPYQVFRDIRFRAFQIEVRDSIMDQLNRALAEVSYLFGGQVGLHFNGVTTAGQVQELLEDLETGRRPMAEISRRALLG